MDWCFVLHGHCNSELQFLSSQGSLFQHIYSSSIVSQCCRHAVVRASRLCMGDRNCNNYIKVSLNSSQIKIPNLWLPCEVFYARMREKIACFNVKYHVKTHATYVQQ